MKNHIKTGTIIVLDDYDAKDNNFDYKFVETLEHYFDVKLLYKYNSELLGNYEEGGKFVFFEII